MSKYLKSEIIFIIFLAISTILFCGREQKNRRKIKLASDTSGTFISSETSSPTVIRFDSEDRVSIAILTFENQTSDTSLSWLCQGITDMLIRDLSQSRYLKVITMQRIYDVLKKINVDSPCAIRYRMLPEISRETGVEAVLRGSFTNYKDSLLIRVQLHHARTGEILQEQHAVGMGLAQIFGMIDEISQKVKHHMRLGYRGVSDSDMDIADLSTNSWEAYKYYSQGVNFAYKAYFGDAIHKFEQAIQMDSSFAMAQYWAGLIYTKLGRTAEAQAAIRHAMGRIKHTTPIERMKIEWLAAANRGEYQLAFEKMQQIVKAFPDDKMSRYQLAGYHYIRKELDAAMAQLAEVFKLDPEYAQAFILKSAILRDQGKYDKAIEALQQCIRLNPDDASPHHNLGELYELTGQYENAITAYQRAIELKPDFHFSTLNLAHTYSTLGKYELAIETYQNALATVPSKELKAEVYSGLAQVALAQGKYAKAIQHIRLAANYPSSSTEQASYLAMLANIYLRKAVYDSAIVISKRALAIHTPNMAAYQALAIAYAESDQFEAAREIATTVDRFIDQTRLEMYRNLHTRILSKIAAAQGKYKQAIRSCQRILKQNPNASSLLLDMGKYYEALHQPGQAIAQYKAYHTIHRNHAIVCYYLARAYASAGQKRRARHMLNIFFKRWKHADPDIPEMQQAKQLQNQLEG